MGRRPLNRKLGVVILAAGKGTRMASDLAKVLHPVAGRPMLSYVLAAARRLKPDRVAVVIGHQGESVQQHFADQKDISWVWQKEMRGTGDAVRCATPHFEGFDGPILVLYGDIPGIRVETLRRLVMVHGASENAITLLTAELENPEGYGRILLETDGYVARIVEESDASEEERQIQEVNTGIGMYESHFLFSGVESLRPTNRQKEFYLTDLVGIARRAQKTVGRLHTREPLETLGINDRESLAEVSGILYDMKAHELMANGVTLEDPVLTFVEPSVEIGRDAFVGSLARLSGDTRLGGSVRVGTGVSVEDSDVGSEAVIERGAIVCDAKIGVGTRIGPNSRIGRRRD